MSNKIWPAVHGLSWDLKRAPQFMSVAQKGSAPGIETRIGFGPDPVDGWELGYEILYADGNKELEQIDGFFRARRGSLDSFLIDFGAVTKNPAWTSITGQALTVDANYCAPLIRTMAGGYDEAIYELAVDGSGNPIYPTIKHNGVALIRSTHYDVHLWPEVATGALNANDITYSGVVIEFISSPLLITNITADFSWMYRVKFEADEQEFEMFHYLLWKCQSVKLMGTRY